MKKLNLLFAIILSLVGITQARAQDELTVYDNGGTTNNQNVPIRGYYVDVSGQQAEFIIPASKLETMSGGIITKMQFHLSSAISSRKLSGKFDVVLKEVEESSFTTAAALGKTGGTTVFSDEIEAPIGSTTIEVEFQEPYSYGGGNLLVGFYLQGTGNYTYTYFRGETSSNGSWYGSNITLQNFIPQTTFTYELATEGPAFRVKGYKTGDSYDFGLVNPGTTTTFTLSNPGTESVTVNIATTGGYTVDATSKTIDAKGEETVTVTVPDATANGTIIFTPTAAGLDAATINLSVAIKDPSKMYEDFTGSDDVPDGWTATGYKASYSTYNWVFGTDAVGVGYAGYEATSSSYPGSLMTPIVQFEEGEKLYFKSAKYGSSSWNTPSLSVQVSANGNDWTTVETFTDDINGTWTDRAVTIPTTTKYVRFYGWYFYLTQIYGGTYAQIPIMTVTGATDKDFGKVREITSTTFNIKNTGKGELTDISVTTTNDAYTINDAPETLGIGESADVTVQLGVSVFGTQATTITISAPDQETVTFTLTGNVIDPTSVDIDFEDGSFPKDVLAEEGWTVYSTWSSGMYAKNGNTSAKSKLILPKLAIAEGEVLTFDASYESYNSGKNALDILYSADRKEWTVAQSLTFSSSSMSSYTVDNIPVGEYYIAFDGYNVDVDNINGFHKVAVETDLYTTAQNIPATGMVNSPYTATATFKNLANDLAAADYATELLFDDNVMTTATATDLAAGTSQAFSFSFTPYEAGTYNAVIRLTVGNEVFETEPVEVTIAEESAVEDVVVGTFDNNEMQGAPLPKTEAGKLYGATASIYKASDLNLTAGTKIKTITYHGYYYSSYTYPSVKAYLANTSDEAFAEPYDATDVSGMTLIYDGSITANPQASKTLHDKSFAIDIATPFEYTGDNLKVVFVVETTSACSPWFTSDPALGTAITGVGATADELTYTTVNNPQLYLKVEKAPVVISGTVTNSATGTAISGVEVKAQSGDVKYTATTDDNGQYNLSIVKADLTYDFTATKDGYFPYKEEAITLAVSATKDIALQEASGMSITSSSIPTTGTVNNEYSVTVDVQNVDADDKAASDYTVTLYVDGTAVAQAETVTLASQQTETFTLAFTPHAAGEKPVCVKVEWSGKSAQTPEKMVNFKAEVTEAVKQVGTPTGTTNGAPAKLDYNNSYSYSYYTAEMLDLEPGTTLTGITYKGYYTGTKNYDATMEVYLENTTEIAGQTIPKTKVYSGTQTISPKGTATNLADYLVFTFDEPFVYDGNNLKVVVTSSATNYASSPNVFFESMSGTTVSVRFSDDTADAGSMSTTNSAIPVMYLAYDASATMSGKVTTDGETAAVNATVTLTSGDVVYETITDADGNYVLKVAQKDKTYMLTAAAEGEDVSFSEDGITFDDGNLLRNIVLGNQVTITITAAGYATYSSTRTLDFTDVAGLTIYKVTSFNDEKAMIDEVSDKLIAPNTGLLLKGKAGSYTIPLANDDGEELTDNLLLSTSNETVNGDGTSIYALGAKDGVAGFMPVTANTTLRANRAYLILAGSGAKPFIPFDFDDNGLDDGSNGDDTTSISAVDGDAASLIDESQPMYNLAGQRISRNVKGIVIQNGKKIVK